VTYIYLSLCVMIGVGLPLQIAANAGLAARAAGPVFGTFVNFVIGTLAALTIFIWMRIPWPSLSVLVHVPLWNWLGGVLGALFVFSTILVAPKLGAAVTISFIIAAQMGASLIFDHFGWLGYPSHEINFGRVLGGVLLIVGVALIRRF